MICPCGVGIDYLSETYDTYMRISEDPSRPPVRVTWAFTQPGAGMFLGKSPFRSMRWETAFRDSPYEGLGEVDDTLLPANRAIVAESPGKVMSTPVAWMRTGVPDGYNPKLCCGKPLAKRVVELDTPGVLSYLADPASPFVGALIEKGIPGAELQGRTSELLELDTPGATDVNNAPILQEVDTPDVANWMQEASLLEVSTPDAFSWLQEGNVLEVDTADSRASLTGRFFLRQAQRLAFVSPAAFTLKQAQDIELSTPSPLELQQAQDIELS